MRCKNAVPFADNFKKVSNRFKNVTRQLNAVTKTNFLIAEEVLDLAFSSSILPNDINAITTAAASK